jgi:pilus assembly protein Flp/PilA
MYDFVARLVDDEAGATSIEYSLIAVLVSVAVIGAVRLLGSQLMETYNSIAVAMTNG